MNSTNLYGDHELTPADYAAAIYLIQNQDEPEAAWPALPDGVTAEHIAAARRRFDAQRQRNRMAIEAHRKALSTALPPATKPAPVSSIPRRPERAFWFLVYVVIGLLVFGIAYGLAHLFWSPS